MTRSNNFTESSSVFVALQARPSDFLTVAQFKLEVEEVDDAAPDLAKYRHDVSQPLVIQVQYNLSLRADMLCLGVQPGDADEPSNQVQLLQECRGERLADTMPAHRILNSFTEECKNMYECLTVSGHPVSCQQAGAQCSCTLLSWYNNPCPRASVPVVVHKQSDLSLLAGVEPNMLPNNRCKTCGARSEQKP
jgi:hypothetical protein